MRSARNRLRARHRLRRIEVELLDDARRPNAEIAAAVGVRARHVRRERLRLEELGVIDPRRARAERRAAGLTATDDKEEGAR